MTNLPELTNLPEQVQGLAKEYEARRRALLKDLKRSTAESLRSEQRALLIGTDLCMRLWMELKDAILAATHALNESTKQVLSSHSHDADAHAVAGPHTETLPHAPNDAEILRLAIQVAQARAKVLEVDVTLAIHSAGVRVYTTVLERSTASLRELIRQPDVDARRATVQAFVTFVISLIPYVGDALGAVDVLRAGHQRRADADAFLRDLESYHSAALHWSVATQVLLDYVTAGPDRPSDVATALSRVVERIPTLYQRNSTSRITEMP